MLSDDEYVDEVISRAEVNRVTAALKDLLAEVTSPTIRLFLEDFCEDIHCLVDEDDSALASAA